MIRVGLITSNQLQVMTRFSIFMVMKGIERQQASCGIQGVVILLNSNHGLRQLWGRQATELYRACHEVSDKIFDRFKHKGVVGKVWKPRLSLLNRTDAKHPK